MACSSWEKHSVNDVVECIEADHGGDCGDNTRSGRCADSRSAALDGQPSVTGDRADEQTEQKALQNTSDDIANQQRLLYEVEKIGKRDAEIGFADQTAREYCRDVRNSGQTRHQQKQRKQSRRNKETQR